jgi:hypothetical protein
MYVDLYKPGKNSNILNNVSTRRPDDTCMSVFKTACTVVRWSNSRAPGLVPYVDAHMT